MRNYDFICNNCGGLVAQPGKIYGWGGTFCSCETPSKPLPQKLPSILEPTSPLNGEKEQD